MSDWDDAEVERAPICPECGVTALVADVFGTDGAGYVCENPDCEQFGETVPTS